MKLLRAIAVSAFILNAIAWYAYPTWLSRMRSPVPDPADGFVHPLVNHGPPVYITEGEDWMIKGLTILMVILAGLIWFLYREKKIR